MEEFLAFERTLVLRTALEMDLFTRIASGDDTIPALAARTGSAQRGLRILCDFLTVQGHLLKLDDRYTLPLNSQLYLTTTSPAYLGSAVRFLASDDVVRSFCELRQSVEGAAPSPRTLVSRDAHWVEFALGMAPRSRMMAQAAAAALGIEPGRPMGVLDVAAGHGLYGLAAAARNPAARVFALDAPKVLEVAERNARLAGVADRYHLFPGDAFTMDFGGPYDLILVANFAHHFDYATNISLFRRCRAALNSSGRLALIDAIANEDRISPAGSAEMALLMLATTTHGDVYTFREFAEMLEAAGFREALLQDSGGLPPFLIVAFP
jgi:2-polyprenyl-3-methyl-5-hydroxy-6-metoxy-1,4-benzoquinol methylase